jgi:glycosyltransferase involved in cell wall biosynthesis
MIASDLNKNIDNKIRILFFIGKLGAGGKERRLIELLTYLKEKGGYELMLVLTKDIIHYPYFYKLDIPYKIIEKNRKRNDLAVFFKFYQICKQFLPHLIHTWGSMQTFYSLPSVIGQKLPLINSQISSAPPKPKRWSITQLINRINFRFSKVILSNSQAGVDAFKPPVKKIKIIYNGMNMVRFANLPEAEKIKSKYGIATPYAVVMVANFTPNKDYNLFYKIAERVIEIREDITFIGVGGYSPDDAPDDTEYKRIMSLSTGNSKIIFPGKINDVEAVVNACDIGVLFSPNGEGISNAILEYMALGKPVIANAAGGTKEIVHHKKNGYLIQSETVEEIAALIIGLINDQERIESFGKESKRIIAETFTLDKMGKKFELVYKEVMASYTKIKERSFPVTISG